MTDAQYRALLAARRERLVQTAQLQRLQLTQSIQPLVQATRRIQRGISLWHALRARPAPALLCLLAPALALTLYQPRAALRTLAAVLALWRGWSTLRAGLLRG